MKTEIEQLRKEVNERIDALLKKAEPVKFELGKWYKIITKQGNTFITKITKEGKNPFGFSACTSGGSWFNESAVCCLDDITSAKPATPAEIEEALIAEAKRRGFKEGVNFFSVKFKAGAVCDGNFRYDKNLDTLSTGDGSYRWQIYKEGHWAEIIKEEKITIGGYEVKFCENNTYTLIDGNPFTKSVWQAAKVIAEHSKAAVYVGCDAKSGGLNKWMADLETINKILNKLQ